MASPATAPGSSPAALLNLHLDDTYGAFFVGILISAILFGITNLQVFLYFQSYKDDSMWNKFAVASMWVLNALHLALCSHAVYFYVITNYANPLALDSVVWSFRLQMITSLFTIVSVHTMYALRIRKLVSISSIFQQSKIVAKIIPISLFMLIIAEAVAYIAFDRVFYLHNKWSEVETMKWATFRIFIFGIVADVVVAVSMCFILARLRSGITQSDAVVNSLILYILSSGVLTSFCALVTFVMYWIFPHDFIFIAVFVLLVNLYVNSFLAMFNVRRRLKASFNKGNLIPEWYDAANLHGQPDQIRLRTATGGGDVSQQSESDEQKSSIIDISPSECSA